VENDQRDITDDQGFHAVSKERKKGKGGPKRSGLHVVNYLRTKKKKKKRNQKKKKKTQNSNKPAETLRKKRKTKKIQMLRGQQTLGKSQHQEK